MMTVFDVEATRRAIGSAVPEEVSAHGDAPVPENLYVPLRHAQALSPDHSLVVGIRGAGKSVWWAALQSERHREVVSAALPSLALQQLSDVSAGFGEKNRPDDYPDKRTIRLLLDQGIAPADVWRTVVAWNTWGRNGGIAEKTTWLSRAQWLGSHPEEVARAFNEYDEKFAETGRKHLILFDALDRSADQWRDLRQLLRGLLEVLLDLRTFRAVRAKAFVRPDMLDDSEVINFRDASKVIAGKVELRWARVDLYGLLFHLVGNEAADGSSFRDGCEALGSGKWQAVGNIWQVPMLLREREDLQRKVFDQLAGKWMGKDPRRGFPYTWLPNHLADAVGQVSPRSFLVAIRTAAESSFGHRGDFPVHYEGIKQGVQKASQIRVDEVREDFPWLKTLMEPLKGLVIPCDFSEIELRWKSANVVARLKRDADESGVMLPKHFEEDLEGFRNDLIDLALFSRQRDGRINMPDVYRVGFGLGRKGGVIPIR